MGCSYTLFVPDASFRLSTLLGITLREYNQTSDISRTYMCLYDLQEQIYPLTGDEIYIHKASSGI